MLTVNAQCRKYLQNMQCCILLSLIVNLAACMGPTIIYTSSPNTLIKQGLKAEATGNIDNARRAYTEAAKLSGRGNMYLGNLAYQSKDFATAERQYRLALRDVPDNAALYNNLAWSLLKQKHKLDEAEEFAMLAVQRSDEKTLSITWETLNTIRQIRNKPISPTPPKRLIEQSKKKASKKVSPKQISPKQTSPKKTPPKKVLPKQTSPKKELDSVQKALGTMRQPDSADSVQKALGTMRQPDSVDSADSVQEALKTMQETPDAIQQALDDLETRFIHVKP